MYAECKLREWIKNFKLHIVMQFEKYYAPLLIKIDLIFTNSFIPNPPCSRPKPESLTPPNGILGASLV